MIVEDVLLTMVKMVSRKNLEDQVNALGALVRFIDSSDAQSQWSLIELDRILLALNTFLLYFVLAYSSSSFGINSLT